VVGDVELADSEARKRQQVDAADAAKARDGDAPVP
jgi:hypothetical protein